MHTTGYVVLIGLALATPVRGQDLSTMTVAEFLEMESPQQYAVAGALLGTMVAVGELAPRDDAGDSNQVAECLANWEKSHPDDYMQILTGSWVDVLELGAAAAGFGDQTSANDPRAQPVLEVLLGLFLLSCETDVAPSPERAAEQVSAATALEGGADQCLYDVRDRGFTWESSPNCGALPLLVTEYIGLGGFQGGVGVDLEARLVAERARSVAWMARATSLAPGRTLRIW